MKISTNIVTVKVNGVEYLPVERRRLSSKVEVVIRVGKEELTFRTAAEHTPDEILWVAIRNRHAISFERCRKFPNRALDKPKTKSAVMIVSHAPVTTIRGTLGVRL
jgi:hypothetical protein